MSEPYQLDAPIEEVLPLNSVPGTGVHQPEDTGNQVICVGEDSAASCCSDKYHRKLAISSIICGFSCLGVPALVYSVKVCYFLCRQETYSKPAFENFIMRISMFIFDKHLICYISLLVIHHVCLAWSVNQKYCHIFTSPGWECWQSWESQPDKWKESCKVFKTGQKMEHHLHRDMGFHPGVSFFDTGITGAGPIKPGLWLTNLSGAHPGECL